MPGVLPEAAPTSGRRAGIDGPSGTPSLWLDSPRATVPADARGLVVRTHGLAPEDIRTACDALLSVHHATAGAEGNVSVPLDPRYLRDPGAFRAAARRLRDTVARPNLLIAVPATRRGRSALCGCLADGIGVHATHVYSAEQFGAALAAHTAGTRRARALGTPPRATSVVSVHVGPLDTAVDAALDLAGTAEAKALRGRSGIAAARLAYEQYEQYEQYALYERHGKYEQHGKYEPYEPYEIRRAQQGDRPRLLWTGLTEHHPGGHARYLEELAAPGALAALPAPALATAAATRTHALVPRRWTRETYDDARRTLRYLEWFGISHEHLASALQSAATTGEPS